MEENQDEHYLISQRRDKLSLLRSQGNAYPNHFRRDALAQELHNQYHNASQERLESSRIPVQIAGRIMAKRIMGKASFAVLQDMSGRIQLFIQKEQVGESCYEAFKSWDIGDILGATGVVFRTKTGELSVRAETIVLLTKTLRPLPEKFHGLTDQESRFRRRYLDLIMNEPVRKIFQKRAEIIRIVRSFLVERGFIEVETPMMQPLPGGATARPFITHHNALDMQLYLRIAPELYLKRLVVGGFERVFELNRNFRNEGVSTRHNPEFTMLEFYQAYADYHDLMDMTEVLFRQLCESIVGDMALTYQGETIDFSQSFRRVTLKESIYQARPDIAAGALDDKVFLQNLAKQHQIPVHPTDGVGKLQLALFEKWVEPHLLQPTFITAYPLEVSPLARRNDEDPTLTDRFELFIAGREIANGFSELNDPEDQASRFRQQVEEKAAGDEEAMYYDEEYVEALEYGLPPTAGEGIGIDRLVMLLTDSPSIRDVLLFPLLRHSEKR